MNKTHEISDDIKQDIYSHLENVKEQIEMMDFTTNSVDYTHDDIVNALIDDLDLFDKFYELKKLKEQMSNEDYRDNLETARNTYKDATGGY